MYFQRNLFRILNYIRVLLVVGALLICWEVKAEENDDYQIQSIACQKFDESIKSGQHCADTMFVLWKVYCRYECCPSGEMKKTNCRYHHIGLKEYPLCDDLYCARKKQASQTTTEPAETTTEEGK